MKRHHTHPGKRRAERLAVEAEARRTWVTRLTARLVAERKAGPRWLNTVGLKRQYVPGKEQYKVLTTHGSNAIRRRRRANKIAHESRRRNFA